ncbi:MAG: Poly(3-hydroxybutyrate) depolymerase-like protein [Phenylobacterium sp.]|nr:Poly(3-hydroxybutyrate) depolymerase-like protein [Phenylobacterium sp.]
MGKSVKAFGGMRPRRLMAAPLALLFAATAGAAFAQPAPPAGPAAAARPDGTIALRRNTVTADGQDRDYFYYIPANVDRAGFNQIVYVLPDDGMTAAQFAEQSGWTKVADAKGFVVVFLEPQQKQWGPSAGGEDAYVKAVLAHAGSHMTIPAPGGPGGGPGGRGGGAAPPAGGEGGGGRRGGDGAVRIRTWAPFHYLTGVGMGANIAQAFAMNHPGLYAAVATFGGGAYDEAYAKGEEPSEANDLHLWAGKALVPIWKQQKKDVPAAVWLFGAGSVDARQADYWKRADRVAAAGANATFGGQPTTVYTSPDNPAQQVRTTVLPAGARYDEAVASTIWNDLFAHVARWTSSPNGDVGQLLTKAEVDKGFDVRTIQVGDRTYTYYVKTPSSYRKGKSLPVVLSAHGFAFPVWQYLNQIKMHEVGEKEGFITVYLQGQNDAWNFEEPEGPDSQYIQKVIAAVKADYKADPRRVYMQGFSFGSGLTYMMGLTHPQLFAAVSPNSGIGPMPKAVEARIAELKAKSDVRMPMMLVYGTADRGGTIDGELPAKGILQGALDEVKAYNHITTADASQPFHSPTGPDYRVLVPGGALASEAVDARYPQGRFKTWTYSSADAAPRDLLKFVWVLDLTHGGDVREAQTEWDYFKHWRRNPDGSLAYSAK